MISGVRVTWVIRFPDSRSSIRGEGVDYLIFRSRLQLSFRDNFARTLAVEAS